MAILYAFDEHKNKVVFDDEETIPIIHSMIIPIIFNNHR